MAGGGALRGSAERAGGEWVQRPVFGYRLDERRVALCGMSLNPNRLLVLDRAFALAVSVHQLADRQQRSLARVSPGLRAQLLRAVDSIPFNLAEAAGQASPGRCAHHLAIAIGNCNELELQLRLASALEALDSAQANLLITETGEIRAMTYGLKRRVLAKPA